MLTTERLILRPWREEDKAPFAAINADKDVMRYFPRLMSADQSDAMVDRQMAAMREKGYCFWAAELRATGQCIGMIGIQDVPDYHDFGPGLEIGWRLSRETWGQGLAPEGARAALLYAFSKVGAGDVFSFTAAINKPSARVMEKIGMTRVFGGDFDHPMVDAGHPVCPHVLYHIKATDRIL